MLRSGVVSGAIGRVEIWTAAAGQPRDRLTGGVIIARPRSRKSRRTRSVNKKCMRSDTSSTVVDARAPRATERTRAGLVEHRDCVERGFLLLPIAEQQLRDGRPMPRTRQHPMPPALGERFKNPDLTAAASHGLRELATQAMDLGMLIEGRSRTGAAQCVGGARSAS